MKILFLHQNPYRKIQYDQAVNHLEHRVIYCGLKKFLDQVPDSLSCEKWEINDWDNDKFKIITQIKKMNGVDRIITRQEKLLQLAANLRYQFGLPGLTPDETEGYRDKSYMKKKIINAGICVPQAVEASEFILKKNVSIPWKNKTILKPKDGASSVGIVKCDTPQAALKWLQNEQSINIKNYLVEKYLEGAVYYLDGFFYHGEIIEMVASRYINTCLSYAGGQPMGTVQVKDANLQDFAATCLRALGGDCITFHLELIMTETGPVFLECAARAGGGEIAEIFHRATGTHLHNLDIATQVSGKLAIEYFKQKYAPEVFGQFLIPSNFSANLKNLASQFKRFKNDVFVIHWHENLEKQCLNSKVTYQFEELPLAGIVRNHTTENLEIWINKLFSALSH